ncbi:MAG: hypothetical protein H0V40_12465 [Actinobacteria bacterium]|nr:hypothetical protein [Actinomycetota bacterium]
MTGIYDEAQTLYGNPDRTFPILAQLRTQLIRVNLYWGHPQFGVSKARPLYFQDPDEPGKYDWGIYDRLVLYAQQYNIRVVFSIVGTPRWANGGKGFNVPPTNGADLKRFAYTAATRYVGTKVNNDGITLPKVRHWVAWNEPNNPNFLKTQFKRVGAGYVIQSARDYAKICNAVVTGIKSTLIRDNKVACGVTGPRGNNNPKAPRSSVSPLAFLRAMKAAGAKGFDAYAHHPYSGGASQEPTKAPPLVKGKFGTSVELGNIDVLIAELTRLYGRKPLWITEYAYQTNPPDRVFGVSNTLQAKYLTQAFVLARKHPRIDMMLWFLIRDENFLDGWQSGFFTATGKKKPSFNAFRNLNAAFRALNKR